MSMFVCHCCHTCVGHEYLTLVSWWVLLPQAKDGEKYVIDLTMQCFPTDPKIKTESGTRKAFIVFLFTGCIL